MGLWVPKNLRRKARRVIGSWVWESAELVGREGWKEAEGNSGKQGHKDEDGGALINVSH